MRILMTNDDGIEADGLRFLAEALSSRADVTVVAPELNQSGFGHAITLNRPLRVREREPGWFSIDGTPTDCVNYGVHHLKEHGPPDLVVSGINHGVNLGDDVTYSGTVGAAMEGFLLGVPSLALSQELGEGVDFRHSARLGVALLDRLSNLPSLEGLFLNVNFPAQGSGSFELVSLGHRRYHEVVQVRTDPRGGEYFWIAGQPTWRDDPGTDQDALARGVISITPLHLGLTDASAMAPGSPLRSLDASGLEVGVRPSAGGSRGED
ncbi:MAG: 5'/3'-nucleotidase SurE [Acidobacteriota bacterium]